MPVLPLELDAGSSVALLGRLATAVNLGDGGSSDVWAPEVVTAADGLRAGLPAVIVCRSTTVPIPSGRLRLAGSADVALVVVGYTRRTRASTSASSPPLT